AGRARAKEDCPIRDRVGEVALRGGNGDDGVLEEDGCPGGRDAAGVEIGVEPDVIIRADRSRIKIRLNSTAHWRTVCSTALNVNLLGTTAEIAGTIGRRPGAGD